MAWSGSVVAHVVITCAGALLATAERAPLGWREIVIRQKAPTELSVELPGLSLETLASIRVETEEDLPDASAGGELQPRPDSGRDGRGGDREVSAAAINLASRDDEATLMPLLESRIDRSQ